MYNEEVFASLDWVLDQAAQRKIRIIIPFEARARPPLLAGAGLPASWLQIWLIACRASAPCVHWMMWRQRHACSTAPALPRSTGLAACKRAVMA